MLKKLRRIAVRLVQRLGIIFALVISLGRLRKNYIVDRRAGAGEGGPNGKVCVFAHYDRKGEVHGYVLHYLEELRHSGFKIVFVSNAPNLSPGAIADVSRLAHMVLCRRNFGGYFGAYKDGIAAIGDLGQIDLLLLANDHLYGPFWTLDDVFARMARLPGQFWGLTDSWDRAYHLECDFVMFGREAISSTAFRNFWSKVRYVNSSIYVMQKYEVGLSQQLIRAGMRGTALCNYRHMSGVILDAVRNGGLNSEKLAEWQEHLLTAYETVQKGLPFNIAAYLWDYLIEQMGYPFIKRELFQRTRVRAPFISQWQGVVTRASDYDTDLIVRHLETTLRNRFT